MNLKVDKALVQKYLNGTCDAQELACITEFLKNPDAQQLFDEVWDEQWADRIKSGLDVIEPGQMKLWKTTMQEKIGEAGLADEEIQKPFFKRIKVWQYAAIWATLLVGISLWMVQFKKAAVPEAPVYVEKYNPNGRRTIITLPDSSQVYLGAGSKLRYTEKFSGVTREVNLEGEAFFEVVKNPEKPFIIHTGTITTRVLGTSFKVDAFLNQPLTVLVSTGKVRVDRHVGHQTESLAVLTPGQTVTWNEKSHLKTLGTTQVADISGWKDGRLVFNETRLSEITAILERWYAVKIDFKNKKTGDRLMKVNLTANVPINTLMKILSISGQFKFNMQKNQITII